MQRTFAWTPTLSFVCCLMFVPGCGDSDEPSPAGTGGAGPSGGTAGSGVGGGSAGVVSGGSAGTVTGGAGGLTGGAAGAPVGGSAGVTTGGSSGAPAGGTGGQPTGGTGGQPTGGTGGSGGVPPQPVTPYIVIDQFGYLPSSEKIAVIRDPQTGYDAAQSFTPGATYALVDNADGQQVLTGSAAAWNGGAEDASSGDRAWWFDFSQVTTPGSYYVLDVDQNVRSHVFDISDIVYQQVLKHAVRTFFYQRAGQDKAAQYAGSEWADSASHVGPLQDRNCRLYDDPNNAATERDLSGGWYDAGDYNKYTNWHASYVVALLRSYEEKPSSWTDDYNIPESGNGIPDLLDEAKWGMDWLIRMQNGDGSVLSIVGEDHDSPPSAATGQSLYGSASTSATLSTAAAFAYGSKVFGALGTAAMTTYASDLLTRAENAYNWADSNPNVMFRNNDAGAGTQGLGAGQQETDDHGRLMKKLEAACYLFEVTGTSSYRDFFDNNYSQVHLIQWTYAYPFETEEQEMLLYYSTLSGATASVANDIRQTYRSAMDGTDNLQAFNNEIDPYLAHMADYVWGSNSTKSNQGLMFYDLITYGLDPSVDADARRAAQRYIHYLHGVNPFGLVYLSNMYAYGAESSVNEFFHAWFTNGSPEWDRVGTSTYGPAPGFLTGGPNPSYDWDGCCPNGCGSPANDAICTSESLEPPRGQPDQKSYKDFNTSWPLNSWEVTENSNGYQVAYIRLLSKFVP